MHENIINICMAYNRDMHGTIGVVIFTLVHCDTGIWIIELSWKWRRRRRRGVMSESWIEFPKIIICIEVPRDITVDLQVILF